MELCLRVREAFLGRKIENVKINPQVLQCNGLEGSELAGVKGIKGSMSYRGLMEAQLQN